MPVKAKDKSAGQKGVPLYDFDSGGGLVDEFDGTIADIRFGNFDYSKPGSEEKNEVLSLLVTFEVDDAEEMHAQYPKQVDEKGTMIEPFGIGRQSEGKFKASKDGAKLLPTGSRNRITGSCAAALFVTSLVDAGFEASRIEDDIRVFAGTRGHFRRQTPEGWSNFAPDERGELPKVILCESVGEVEETPTSKAKAKAKSNGPGTIDQATLVEWIEGMLSEEDLTPDDIKERIVEHEEWPVKVKKTFTELLDADDFLESGGSWTYADGVLK